MNAEIENLNIFDKNDAVEIAVTADVGERKEIVHFFDKSLNENTKNIFVAKIDNKIIGVIGWYQDKGSFIKKILGNIFPTGQNIYWVSFFAVDTDYRSHGVGTLLMKKLLDELKNKKAAELWTYSRRAKIFYKKMGFKFVTNKILDGDPHDFLKYIFS